MGNVSDGPCCPVAHPYGQLQLELEGIEPLTEDEKIARWLDSETNVDSVRFRSGVLRLEDSVSRTERAMRWVRVREIQAPFYSPYYLVPGGGEAVWLYQEAISCFIHGMPLASLLCSHAAVERVLADHLVMVSGGPHGDLRKKIDRWGLGALIAEAVRRGLISDDTRSQLEIMNERRRVTAHFKHPLDPSSLHNRVFAASGGEAVPEDSFYQLAMRDADQALVTSTLLLRSREGPAGRL
jgi:hypothetical protein